MKPVLRTHIPHRPEVRLPAFLARSLFAGTFALTSLLMAPAADPASYWKRAPIVSDAAVARGHLGGEGGQLIMCMAISKSDPNFMLMGSDVGGLQRSTDGGATWVPSMRGFGARGAHSVAIDPANANHAMVVTSQSKAATWGSNYLGLWRTTDKGVTWTRVWDPVKKLPVFLSAAARSIKLYMTTRASTAPGAPASTGRRPMMGAPTMAVPSQLARVAFGVRRTPAPPGRKYLRQRTTPT